MNFFRFFSRLVVFTCLIFILVSCGKEPETTAMLIDPAKDPVMSAKMIDILFSDSGRIQARLTGPLMNRYTGATPYLELPEGFLITIYDSAHRTTTTIRGNRGVRHEPTRVMEAWGNVIVRNEVKKEQLNTEHLIWDENRRRIYADGTVKITTPDKTLTGSQMESNDSFTDYTISNVTGQMKINRDSL